MKDGVSPVDTEEVKTLIKSCLETAALVNYTKLSAEAKIEDDLSGDVCVPPNKKLADLIQLAEMCVDLLQQNGEHYSEVLVGFLEPNHALRDPREEQSYGKDKGPESPVNGERNSNASASVIEPRFYLFLLWYTNTPLPKYRNAFANERSERLSASFFRSKFLDRSPFNVLPH